MGAPRQQAAELRARILFLRKRAGLRSFQVAKKCGVAASTYSCWERGHSVPTYANLARIAKAFGVSLSEFWGVHVPRPARAER